MEKCKVWTTCGHLKNKRCQKSRRWKCRPFVPCTSLSSSSFTNCAFDKSKSKSVSNFRTADGTLATISWPLLRTLRLRGPRIIIFLNALKVRTWSFVLPLQTCTFYHYLVFGWVLACFHHSVAEFLAEHWAHLGLTSLKCKNNYTHLLVNAQIDISQHL